MQFKIPSLNALSNSLEEPNSYRKSHLHEHEHENDHSHEHDHSHGHEKHWLKACLGLFWGIGLIALSVASLNIPMTAYYVITGLTALMTFYLGRTVYQSAWHSLHEKKWGISTLYTISTLTIVAVSILNLFIPGLPLMIEGAPLVLGFWHLGEAIEHTLVNKINNKLDVRDCIPPLVFLRGKPDKEVFVQNLKIGDVISVKKGGTIPVDGELIGNNALLYTTRYNGSPNPTQFKLGATVRSGMRLDDSIESLEIRVTKTYDDSYLSLVAKNNKHANKEKAPIELLANTILTYFIPGLILTAIVSGVTIGSLFGPALAIQCVVSVLVSACPCALSLITPLAVKIGMNKAGEQGIHFKNGKALQATADIDTIVFDLNGTLTEGNMRVQQLHIKDKRFLNHIALLEGQSDHPVAKTIKTYIESLKFAPSLTPLKISSVDKSHHAGIKALINGVVFMIGNKEMLLDNGIQDFKEPYNNAEQGSLYIICGTEIIGQISLIDPLRQDAIATVNALRRLGKNIHICTGSDKAFAEEYAVILGVSERNVCYNSLGVTNNSQEASKANYIKQLQRHGAKVAMVGDAANDLEAIGCSDIGIGIMSTIGDKITQQEAGIVVQQGLLFPIVTALDVAKKTKQNIFQNLSISLTYNSMITLVAAGLFISLGFALSPGLGVAMMVLESTIVLMNLYRFKIQDIISAATPNTPPINTSKNTTATILTALNHDGRLVQSISNPPQIFPGLIRGLDSEIDKPSAVDAADNLQFIGMR